MNSEIHCPACDKVLKLYALTRATKEPTYVCIPCGLKHIIRSHRILHKGYTIGTQR